MRPMFPDPLVPRSDGLDENVRTPLEAAAGTVANGALILAVAAVVIGSVLWLVGTVTHHPQWSEKGVMTLIGAAAGAVVCAGLNGWVAFFGDYALTFWN